MEKARALGNPGPSLSTSAPAATGAPAAAFESPFELDTEALFGVCLGSEFSSRLVYARQTVKLFTFLWAHTVICAQVPRQARAINRHDLSPPDQNLMGAPQMRLSARKFLVRKAPTALERKWNTQNIRRPKDDVIVSPMWR